MKMRTDVEILESSRSLPYIGGSYFEPAEAIEALGNLVLSPDDLAQAVVGQHLKAESTEDGYYLQSLYDFLQKHCSESDIIFALYRHENGYLVAPYIYSEERLSDFEIQVSSGIIQLVGYYSVSRRDTDGRLSM